MLYPLKFKPHFKQSLWGGNNLRKLNKSIVGDKTGESWELSCHPDGISEIGNGRFTGVPFTEMLDIWGTDLSGSEIRMSDSGKFPLLLKLIDANDKLSVQVHPDDEYAQMNENGSGKNEAWYIIDANPGARVVHGLIPGTTAELFRQALLEGSCERFLRYVNVFPGDVLYIPAGMVHAIGEGILLAEIQQSSNTTYRLFDYNRTDASGEKRPLQMGKAMDVIDFESNCRGTKTKGLKCTLEDNASRTILVASSCFAMELFEIFGEFQDKADGKKFYVYTFLDGKGEICYRNGIEEVKKGDTVLIPAALGEYKISGRFKALRTYVPDLEKDIIRHLADSGYSYSEIYGRISGLSYMELPV